jgi:hypothetical protein
MYGWKNVPLMGAAIQMRDMTVGERPMYVKYGFRSLN